MLLLSFLLSLVLLIPLKAAAVDIEMIVFKQSNTANQQQNYDFGSKYQQAKHDKMQRLMNNTRQVFNGSELLRLTPAMNRLRAANYQILFTQKWKINELPNNQSQSIAISNRNESLTGILTFTPRGALVTDLFLRYRPAGKIATDTDPAYFIQQNRRLISGNFYYVDNAQFAAIIGIWGASL